MSFPAYPSYSNSGVEWLGDVPSHWLIAPLKRRANVITERTERRTRQVALENIEGWTGRLIESDTKFEAEGIAYEAGDLLYGKLRPYLAKAYAAESRGEAVGDFHVLRPRQDICGRYLMYALLTREIVALLDGSTFGAKMPRVSWEFMGMVPFSFPPKVEQEAIVDFLDRETAKIDALVEEQRQLIELLKEKRQAVISHAVTKGLDPNVCMKNSRVEWLGDVPAHWIVTTVKRCFGSLDGRRIPLSSEERGGRSGQYPYYGASGIIDYVDDFLFDEDLVLVSEDGANLLNRSTPIAFVATGKYWVNNHAHILKPCDDHLSFWAERIEAIDLTPVVTGSAQPKLTADALANLPIAVPPEPAERAQIASHIDTCKREIDPLIDQSVKAIGLLQERRAALISAAVTGKIDVRGACPAKIEAEAA